MHKLGVKPEIILNGQKILCLHACGLKFIDSLNYFNTSLAKLPRMFALREMSKGFFPHLFSTPENQNYIGQMPDPRYYDPDGMSATQKLEFEEWYTKQDHFDYQRDLLRYCISDVDILQRACGKFRADFLIQTQNIEPFLSGITIAAACNVVYRTLFLQHEQIPVIPTHGYHSDLQSVEAWCWMDWLAMVKGMKVQHAFNGGEVVIEGYKIDGVLENGEILEFHGCFWHGHEACYPNGDTINPVNGQSMEDLRHFTKYKCDKLRRKGYVVTEVWECEFHATLKSSKELSAYYAQYKKYSPLNPRDAFKGGRTNAIALYCEPSFGEQIQYVDFTSLYPYICKVGLFPLGHPEILYGKHIPLQIQGLMRCKVIPPSKLYHPVLPYTVREKLMFPLCATCAEENVQTNCTHSDDERALVGTWVTLELDKAVEMGYVIVERYVAWHYPNTTQYDPAPKQGGLWAECMNLWLKGKQQADGYPDWCKTEEDRTHYITEYHTKEGILLDHREIDKNESKRALCKLMMNSHWGKFGQNPSKCKISYISDPREYVQKMTDDGIEVTDLFYVNQEHIGLRWRSKSDFVEPLPNTNVVLAAYTTAQARLKLYSLLEKLDDRVLYMDTDSVIYLHRDGEWNPPLGPFLGELKDETKGIPITKFCSAGPKNYSYELSDGTQVCKIKGFRLNHRNSLKLNFDSMKQLVMTPSDRKVIRIQEPRKIVRINGNIYSRPQTKDYRLVYEKRIVTPTLKTFPFGWKGDL